MDGENRLKYLLENELVNDPTVELPFPIGYEADAKLIVKDLAMMPHAFICGVSGAGKTSLVQTALAVMIAKKPAGTVRLLIYASKYSDYQIFEGNPFLLTPAIHDTKKGAGALQWAKVEALKRYRLLAENKKKDLVSYNRTAEEQLPRVVIVVDDLFDLLQSTSDSADAREALQYLLSNGRQVGLHCLVVSATVSNKFVRNDFLPLIPSKMCFAVASAADSKTVLGTANAAKLGYPGELIFKGINAQHILHAPYVSDEALLSFTESFFSSVFMNGTEKDIEEHMKRAASFCTQDSNIPNITEQGVEVYDEMLPLAVEAILDTRQCSVAMIQRRVKLGYSRAARIVDQMEELGIVGPYEGAKPRVVLIDREAWEEIREVLEEIGKLKESQDVETELRNEDNRAHFCKICGKPLMTNAKFCIYCGASV